MVALHEKGISLVRGLPDRRAAPPRDGNCDYNVPIIQLDKATVGEPEFSELFISHLLARNVRVEADLVDQLFNSQRGFDGECSAREQF